MRLPNFAPWDRSASHEGNLPEYLSSIEEEPFDEEEEEVSEEDDDSIDEVSDGDGEAVEVDSREEKTSSEASESDEENQLEGDDYGDSELETPHAAVRTEQQRRASSGQQLGDDKSSSSSIQRGPSSGPGVRAVYQNEESAHILETATSTPDKHEPELQTLEPVQRPRRSRSFGRPPIPRKFSRRTPWTTAVKEVIETRTSKNPHGQHVKRRYCPLGKKYYRCANGFTGCCSVNPCNVGSTCPDGKGHRDSPKASSAAASSATDAGRLRSTTATRTVILHKSTSAARDSQSILKATSTDLKQAASSTTTIPSAATPSCPSDNGKTYTDNSEVTYKIRCSSNNTYATNSTIAVGTGGYAQCFSACSHSQSCAGFTYIGTSSGTCYLKSQMPSGSYVSETKGGARYVSCEKTDPTAAAPNATDTATSNGTSKGAKIGAIVGGILGGILLIILILLLIACLAKRHRKKIERKRATITHVIQGPIETQQSNPGGHQRQGSSGHDVFQPFGGVYNSPPFPHTRQRSIYRDQGWV